MFLESIEGMTSDMIGMLNLYQTTSLSENQCKIISNLSRNLQVIADLSQADMFIDCFLPGRNAAIVVAEAHPSTTQSLYRNSVVGQIAYEENEPGVLFSLQTGKSVIGSRGISQEHVVMQQDIVPITDEYGMTIAVLIKEQDISQLIQNEKNVKMLMHSSSAGEKQTVLQSMMMQEIHHRVKNNLQVIASLLRLQMRRSSSKEVTEVFQDSISRISSMALIHDYLAKMGMDEVDVTFVMEQMATLLLSSFHIPNKHIEIHVQGESLVLRSDKATSVALVVNELVQNCMKHAFRSKNEGKIEICINDRKQMAFIIVQDNGCGMEEAFSSQGSSLGLQLVKMLVEEELQGELSFFHSVKGTKVSISFPIPEKVMM